MTIEGEYTIEVIDPKANESTLFGVFRSAEHAAEIIEKMRRWGVDAEFEAIPLERFSLQALRECGWLEED